MKAVIWGNRGSIPVPGIETVNYGGNTPCIEITADTNSILILDAGSGIRMLGNKLANENSDKEINIFITHKHWDHIQGLPFFRPLYNENFIINIYAPASKADEVKKIISTQMLPQHFPVGENIFKAKINYFSVSEDAKFNIGNIVIESKQVHHSRNTFSYKINESNKSLVYMTDNELYFDEKIDSPKLESIEKRNSELIEFCKNADLLIHDTMYTPQDYILRRNWGHSSSEAVAYFAVISGVKKLLFFHYEPGYTDDQVKELCDRATELVHSINSNIKCIPSTQNLEVTV